MSDALTCENCTYYVYNEDYDEYECLVNLDEDEYYALISGQRKACPYYRKDDEYGIVKKQM